MANLTKSLKTQIVNALGPTPSTKWGGTFLWTPVTNTVGNGCWGMKSAAVAGIPALTVVYGGNLTVLLRETFTLTYANITKTITDGRSFYYEVPNHTTNLENQFIPTYTSATAASPVYVSATVATTLWS